MKTYSVPNMTVIQLQHSDVIVTSGGPAMSGGPGNSDDDLDGDF